MLTAILAVVLAITSACSGSALDFSDDRAVIGGHDAKIEDIPYAAVLMYRGRFLCGSTIISKKYLLTAAHCVKDRNETGLLTVRVGSSFREKDGVVHKVKRAIPHPTFGQMGLACDAAVMELEKPIEFNKYSQPINVTDREPKKGEIARISGWGKNGINSRPAQLQTVQIPILDRLECKNKTNYNIVESMICTFEMNKSPFQGDSGGPIVVDGKVVGAVSFAFMPNPTASPAGYANFAYPSIREFIRKESGI